jgi:hypothetical protein
MELFYARYYHHRLVTWNLSPYVQYFTKVLQEVPILGCVGLAGDQRLSFIQHTTAARAGHCAIHQSGEINESGLSGK